jgi:hypothetical protein
MRFHDETSHALARLVAMLLENWPWWAVVIVGYALSGLRPPREIFVAQSKGVAAAAEATPTHGLGVGSFDDRANVNSRLSSKQPS